MAYVLVNESDVVVWPSAAATTVQEIGVKAAAEEFGVSEGKLRGFLNQNGWVGKRSTSWEKAEAPADTEQIVLTEEEQAALNEPDEVPY